MKMRTAVAVSAVVAIAAAGPALGGDWKDASGHGRWWRGAGKDEFRDGPCVVKREAGRRELMTEIKCKDGVGAGWHGEWRREFRDGPCTVKIDAKRDEYKEEVKCDH